MCDAAEASILSNQMQIHDESALAHSILVPDRLPSCLALELEVDKTLSRLKKGKLWPHLPEQQRAQFKLNCQKVTRELASELFTHLSNILQDQIPALSSLIIRDKAKITISEIREFQKALREVHSDEPMISGYKLLANAVEKGTRDCRNWLRKHCKNKEERTRRADERSQAREMEEISPLSKIAKRSAVSFRDNRPRKTKLAGRKMAENEVEEEKEEEEEGMEEGEELVEEEEGEEEEEEIMEEEEEEEESRKKKEEEKAVSPFIGKDELEEGAGKEEAVTQFFGKGVEITREEDELVFTASRVELLLQTLASVMESKPQQHQEAVDSSTFPIQQAAASSSSNHPPLFVQEQVKEVTSKGKRKPDPKIKDARASLLAALKLMDDIFEFKEEE